MRKDLFLLGTRILGLMQLVSGVTSAVYLILEYSGYLHPQVPTHEYTLVRFGVELVIGLFLLLRPHVVYNFVKQLSVDDDEAPAA